LVIIIARILSHSCCTDENWIVNTIYGSEEYVVYGKRVTIFGNVRPHPLVS
jgi:hypothetical protein